MSEMHYLIAMSPSNSFLQTTYRQQWHPWEETNRIWGSGDLQLHWAWGRNFPKLFCWNALPTWKQWAQSEPWLRSRMKSNASGWGQDQHSPSPCLSLCEMNPFQPLGQMLKLNHGFHESCTIFITAKNDQVTFQAQSAASSVCLLLWGLCGAYFQD